MNATLSSVFSIILTANPGITRLGGWLCNGGRTLWCYVMNTIEDNLNQRISARIRIERESRGWSLNDLAERAGASRAMIHKIERGESSPTASMLGRLSGAFGISMSTLIARAEMQEGKLLRFASQPVWRDPQSHYLPPPRFAAQRSADRSGAD